MKVTFADHATKERDVDVVFPDAEVKIIDCQDDRLVRRQQVQSNYRSEAPLLIPIARYGVIFAASLVS